MKWLAIEGHPGYEVSDFGLVRHGDKLLAARRVCGGQYLGVCLSRNVQEYIHRLVAHAFIGEIPPGFHVNHLNANTYDNRVENLEICTPMDNARHAHWPIWYRDQVRIPVFN